MLLRAQHLPGNKICGGIYPPYWSTDQTPTFLQSDILTSNHQYNDNAKKNITDHGVDGEESFVSAQTLSESRKFG